MITNEKLGIKLEVYIWPLFILLAVSGLEKIQNTKKIKKKILYNHSNPEKEHFKDIIKSIMPVINLLNFRPQLEINKLER